jgi:hypothetical protein
VKGLLRVHEMEAKGLGGGEGLSVRSRRGDKELAECEELATASAST